MALMPVVQSNLIVSSSYNSVGGPQQILLAFPSRTPYCPRIRKSCALRESDPRTPGWKGSCSFVTDTINSSLFQGILPSSWRDMHVTPLPKKKQSAHVPYKFRPIAATPTELKIYKRFILGQIPPFWEIQLPKLIGIQKGQKRLGCSRPPRTHYCEVTRWRFKGTQSGFCGF